MSLGLNLMDLFPKYFNAVPFAAAAVVTGGEVQFEATPEETAKIIADLEASPAIEGISSLGFQRREGERKLVVRLTVEAWVFAARSNGRMG